MTINNVKSKLCDQSNFFYFLDLYFDEGYYFFENIIFDNSQLSKNINALYNILNSISQHDMKKIIYQIGCLYSVDQIITRDFGKSFKYIKISALKYNYSVANKSLGNFYYNGLGTEQNYQKARECYLSAAKQQNPEALYFLGVIYFYGDGIEINYDIARNFFEQSAELGNSNALNQLGYMYYNGDGVEQNYDKAKNYYKTAAKMNHSIAQFNLGSMYYSGIGIKQNYQKAKKYLELSANQNYVNAINFLGHYYDEIEKNYEKAKKCFELAEKQNDPFSRINLGNIYYYGRDVPVDILLAKKYYELSAEQGISEAYYCLGNIYYEDNKNIEKNYEKAREYYEKAAEDYHPNALYNLGIIYYKGLGVSQNINKAIHFFELAAFQNITDSLLYLWKIYFDGFQIGKNIIKAIDYLMIAVEKGNFGALFYLGWIFEDGKYIERDLRKAISYYLKCSQINNDKKNRIIVNLKMGYKDQLNYNDFCYQSNNNLGLIYIIEEKNWQEGKKFIKESAFNEYPFGHNSYGVILQYFNKNDKEAKYFYKKASKKKFILSMFNLARLYESKKKNERSNQLYLELLKYNIEPLCFKNQIIEDERLEVSNVFVKCYTNLKMILYQFQKKESVEKIKKYLINAIFGNFFKYLFSSNTVSYQLVIHKKDTNWHLKYLLLHFPLFNLSDKNVWKEIDRKKDSIEIVIKYKDHTTQNDRFYSYKLNSKKESMIDKNDLDIYDETIDNEIKNIFNSLNINNKFMLVDGGNSSDYLLNGIRFISVKDNVERFLFCPKLLIQDILKNIYYIENEIKEIIRDMDDLISKLPYYVQFGRIPILRQTQSSKITNINHLFYEGFDDLEYSVKSIVAL